MPPAGIRSPAWHVIILGVKTWLSTLETVNLFQLWVNSSTDSWVTRESKPEQKNPVRRRPRKRIVLSSSGTISGCCGRTSGRSTEDPSTLTSGHCGNPTYGSDTALEKATGNHSNTFPRKQPWQLCHACRQGSDATRRHYLTSIYCWQQ